MGAKFVHFYLLYWIVDMVIGVGLCLVGFFAPLVYVRWTLSPLSAAESYGFLIASVVFAGYLWRVRPGKRLYLFPVSLVAMQVAVGAAFHVALARTHPIRITLQSAQVEAMQTPLYLTVALLASLVGIAVWVWIAPDNRSADAPDVPSRLRHLRERREMATQSKP